VSSKPGAGQKAIFLGSIDQILKEVPELYIVDNFAKLLAKEIGIDPNKAPSVEVDANDIKRIRIQLEALGLIKTIPRAKENDGRSYTITTWEITEKGRRYMAENLAQRSGLA
jgi:hypothetical protein